MSEAVINGIFPTPIYMSKLDRKLTPLELKFVEKNNVQSEPIFDAKYLNNPAPLYPTTARDRGIEGKILLEVVVKEDGSALNVKLITSSGSSLLDESAIEAVKNWQFIPAKKFGKFVQAKVIVPIEFKII